MKPSIFTVATATAVLVSAGPLEQRAMETGRVIRVVTVSVTNSQPAPWLTAAVFVEKETAQALPAPTNQFSDSSYQGILLGSHKAHRANHSAEALEWDDTLARYANTVARSCAFEHDMNQGGGGYGQNLAAWGTSGGLGNSTSAAGKAAMDWYNEEANFNYYGASSPPNSAFESVGHFTQMVWKSSKKVGCATVQCPAGSVLSYISWYTVCNYQPPGNFDGEYAANVLPAVGMKALSGNSNFHPNGEI